MRDLCPRGMRNELPIDGKDTQEDEGDEANPSCDRPPFVGNWRNSGKFVDAFDDRCAEVGHVRSV